MYSIKHTVVIYCRTVTRNRGKLFDSLGLMKFTYFGTRANDNRKRNYHRFYSFGVEFFFFYFSFSFSYILYILLWQLFAIQNRMSMHFVQTKGETKKTQERNTSYYAKDQTWFYYKQNQIGSHREPQQFNVNICYTVHSFWK